MLSFKTSIWKGFVVVLLLSLLVACGTSNGNDAGYTDVPADEENHENGQANMDGEEIELPALFPDDYPIPNPAILGIFNDDTEDALLSVNTSMSLEDLEGIYDEFFNQYDELSKHPPSDDQAYPSFSYTVDNEEILISTSIEDRGEHRRVHTSIYRK